MLNNIRRRFEGKQVYTFIGDVLLSVNPYEVSVGVGCLQLYIITNTKFGYSSIDGIVRDATTLTVCTR